MGLQGTEVFTVNFFSTLTRLNRPSSISLSSTTTAQAEDLATACKPATFGRNGEDVLDLTYRKAGKLDAGDFAWNFNPNSEVASGLFPWNSLKQGINFELYKLNVYGISFL